MKILVHSLACLTAVTTVLALPGLERRQDQQQQLVLKPIADDLFKQDVGYQLYKLTKLPTSTSTGWEVAGAIAQNVKLSKEANGWTISGQQAQGCYGWNADQSNGAPGVGWWGCNQYDATARIWNIRCAEGKYIGWQAGGTTATGYMCSFFHGDSADANCLDGDPNNTSTGLKQLKGTCKVTNPAADQILYVLPKGNV